MVSAITASAFGNAGRRALGTPVKAGGGTNRIIAQVVHTVAGSYSDVVPAGATQCDAFVRGPGGNGGASSGYQNTGGGGGGGEAEQSFAVSSGQPLASVVGSAGNISSVTMGGAVQASAASGAAGTGTAVGAGGAGIVGAVLKTGSPGTLSTSGNAGPGGNAAGFFPTGSQLYGGGGSGYPGGNNPNGSSGPLGADGVVVLLFRGP